jgi:hypothetical protein
MKKHSIVVAVSPFRRAPRGYHVRRGLRDETRARGGNEKITAHDRLKIGKPFPDSNPDPSRHSSSGWAAEKTSFYATAPVEWYQGLLLDSCRDYYFSGKKLYGGATVVGLTQFVFLFVLRIVFITTTGKAQFVLIKSKTYKNEGRRIKYTTNPCFLAVLSQPPSRS